MGTEHEHHGPSGGGSWADMAEDLVADAELLSPVRNEALAILRGLLGDRTVTCVLDFGCGPGVTSISLAEAFPGARVTAADGSAELLELAAHRAKAAGVGDRLEVVCIDLEHDAGQFQPFDVLWASMVVHHMADPDAVLGVLAGRVHPGGWIALTEFGGPLSILPPTDELVERGTWARLAQATHDALAHHLPNGHIDDWPVRLARAGFADVAQRELVLDIPAPLGQRERSWLMHRLNRERNAVADHLGDDDLAAVDRLLDPAAVDGLMSRPDLFIRVSRSFITGQGTSVPAPRG